MILWLVLGIAKIFVCCRLSSQVGDKKRKCVRKSQKSMKAGKSALKTAHQPVLVAAQRAE
jgi:hypothetical protein